MLSLLENSEQAINNVEVIKKTGEIVNLAGRFGLHSVDLSKAIYFPKGLLGFQPDLNFALVNFPKPDMQGFKILQCINDPSVSLPVLPSSFNNSFVEQKDMEECLKACEVSKENLALLFIVSSVKKPNGEFDLFVNTKAPIVVDMKLQMAIQHVFTSSKYSVKHPLENNTSK